MTTQTAQVSIQPIVGWPHEAEQGQTYLVTVDVRLAAGAVWPYEQEEYPIYCMLTAGFTYSIRPLGMPAVVLHRFGGSYGPARFLLTALESADDSGLQLSLLNKWGTPILGVPLPMSIVPASERDRHEVIVQVDRPPQTSSQVPDSAQQAEMVRERGQDEDQPAAPDTSSNLPEDYTAAVWIDRDSDWGYARDAQLQQAFDAAAEHLRQVDGYTDPFDPERQTQLCADLALVGGGVNGIGLAGTVIVLDEAGYSFPRVAGTSAGAIVASLVAAISKAGRPMTALRTYLNRLDFANFMPEGKLHRFLEQQGGAMQDANDVGNLLRRTGLYPGAYLVEWLQPILSELGVRTFADLKIAPSDDPGMSLPPNMEYRLVVHASDITRRQLVRLPWDYGYYGLAADEQAVAGAVRASMSIPFFIEPVTVQANEADIDVAMPDGSVLRQHYDAETVTWVDGGMLPSFPIGAFDRVDGQPARWPTIGVKLTSLQTSFGPTEACGTALSVAVCALNTMMNEWDRYTLEESTAARTILIDNAGLTATQFDLTPVQQDQLFINGVRAATQFAIEMSDAGGVPRDAYQGNQLALNRKAAASY